MIKIEGKGNISATVVADSISNGIRITTFELEYPRFIHSEFMTHRQFSRNAASSRAIPIEKMIEQVETKPAKPIYWGTNQAGMTAGEELGVYDIGYGHELWETAANYAGDYAFRMKTLNLHKQIVNRILEPYQMIKVVCTATEYENFFYLRDHPDAQPEIQELAKCMRTAYDTSIPNKLEVGDWHLPYVRGGHWLSQDHFLDDIPTLEMAIKISASLCAQVSYRKADESLDKALKIYDQLVTMKPVHASPFEHQATPMLSYESTSWEEGEAVSEGVTHMDIDGNVWSGNFKGWIQNRQLIKGHVYKGDTNDS